MKIVRTAAEVTKFEDLKTGAVLISSGNNKVYMKIDEIYDDERGYNAVSLEDGSLVNFSDWERIILPRSVTLTVEEREE